MPLSSKNFPFIVRFLFTAVVKSFFNKAACNKDYHMIFTQISDVFVIVTTTWFCLSAMCNICLWCARRAALGRELRIAWGRKPSSQVLQDVEGKAAHQGDDGDFPQERQSCNEVDICKKKRAQSPWRWEVRSGKRCRKAMQSTNT